MDAEAAFWAGMEIKPAGVRSGDGGDDREPEPVPVLRAGPFLAEPSERLRELHDGGLVEHRAAGVDDQSRVSSTGASVSSIEPSGWLWRTAF